MRGLSGRRPYSVKESYWIAYDAFHTMGKVRKTEGAGGLSSKFIRRIMLAITEVNGCQICSYAHTKMALEDGMSNTEIKNMLKGVLEDVPTEEVAAIMFAQHYAESRGRPSEGAWQRVLDLYGIEKAKGILRAVRTIMMGNAFGIAYSSFANRFRGREDPRSGLGYELAMVLGSVIMIPAALVHAGLAIVLRRSLIVFDG